MTLMNKNWGENGSAIYLHLPLPNQTLQPPPPSSPKHETESNKILLGPSSHTFTATIPLEIAPGPPHNIQNEEHERQ
ncbi:hypothetical protein RJT34_29797 [Clitoria ternatea]|uniref:Uncharacterized protein n=1 Tax=Clitoria ternatea TaxID=43366 RepID=A0AAN9ESA2_CLITE